MLHKLYDRYTTFYRIVPCRQVAQTVHPSGTTHLVHQRINIPVDTLTMSGATKTHYQSLSQKAHFRYCAKSIISLQ